MVSGNEIGWLRWLLEMIPIIGWYFSYRRRYQHALDQISKFQRNMKISEASAQSRESKNQRGYRILSVDGGGVRGIIPTLILMELEKRIENHLNLGKKPENHLRCHLSDHFDLMCGTSTGGLIAIAHALARFPLSDVLELYRTGVVFDTQSGWFWKCPRGLYTGSIYSAKPLEQVLKTTLKPEATMKKPMNPTEIESQTNVFVVSGSRTGNDSGPILISNYDKPLNSEYSYVSSDVPLWQAARATSSALFFFPPTKIEADYSYELIDGAHESNNPVEIANNEAKNLFQNRLPDLILSIGTGLEPPKLYKDGILNQICRVTADIAESEKTHRKFISNNNNDEMRSVYYRFNVPMSTIRLDETDPTILKHIEDVTRNWIKEHLRDIDELARILIGQDQTTARLERHITSLNQSKPESPKDFKIGYDQHVAPLLSFLYQYRNNIEQQYGSDWAKHWAQENLKNNGDALFIERARRAMTNSFFKILEEKLRKIEKDGGDPYKFLERGCQIRSIQNALPMLLELDRANFLYYMRNKNGKRGGVWITKNNYDHLPEEKRIEFGLTQNSFSEKLETLFRRCVNDDNDLFNTKYPDWVSKDQ